ncbi:alpha/beta hydrolase fold domain-containing protein [Noviherbaspirillum galbum]|uniref:Alpha/beta hydrolase n=1 Tax=Noviherbaspirillum galbum TaxID=2709383 RepID=A0A6B3SZ21_9BURK|nr:alpha/beta hydrolase [Noviherbaspirillum galbum]NEX63559.1 alpha/beta hydrolase [Noviherbaspirillum galbum]
MPGLPMKFHVLASFAIAAVLATQVSVAGPLRDRLAERRAQHEQHGQQDVRQDGELDDGHGGGPARVPDGVRVLRNEAYGADPLQRFDVYLPQARLQQPAPVLFLVHGGGWRRGDKAMSNVVENKVAHWVPRGFIVISTNYRMLPDTRPVDQARDVAAALAAAQQRAANWGADPGKFVLIGHSAGAHLVAYLAASPATASAAGARPWLGTVALDSAGYDIPKVMQERHFRLYDEAFGNDPQYWQLASPYHQLAQASAPLLAVCSSRRVTSCQQAHAFVARDASLGARAGTLEKDMSHAQINERLGADPVYTAEVERFLQQLDPAIDTLLRRNP